MGWERLRALLVTSMVEGAPLNPSLAWRSTIQPQTALELAAYIIHLQHGGGKKVSSPLFLHSFLSSSLRWCLHCCQLVAPLTLVLVGHSLHRCPFPRVVLFNLLALL
jgi:hypothetical protein